MSYFLKSREPDPVRRAILDGLHQGHRRLDCRISSVIEIGSDGDLFWIWIGTGEDVPDPVPALVLVLDRASGVVTFNFGTAVAVPHSGTFRPRDLGEEKATWPVADVTRTDLVERCVVQWAADLAMI